MAKYAKLITGRDNVVTVVAECMAHDEITVKLPGGEATYRCNQNIPFGHKMAISDLKKGDRVIKYGEPIGTASQDIKTGDWVHIHNVLDEYRCLDKDGNPLPGQ